MDTVRIKAALVWDACVPAVGVSGSSTPHTLLARHGCTRRVVTVRAPVPAPLRDTHQRHAATVGALGMLQRTGGGPADDGARPCPAADRGASTLTCGRTMYTQGCPLDSGPRTAAAPGFLACVVHFEPCRIRREAFDKESKP